MSIFTFFSLVTPPPSRLRSFENLVVLSSNSSKEISKLAARKVPRCYVNRTCPTRAGSAAALPAMHFTEAFSCYFQLVSRHTVLVRLRDGNAVYVRCCDRTFPGVGMRTFEIERRHPSRLGRLIRSVSVRMPIPSNASNFNNERLSLSSRHNYLYLTYLPPAHSIIPERGIFWHKLST